MKVLSWLKSHISQPGPAEVSTLDVLDRPHRRAVRPSTLTPAEQRAEHERLAALAAPLYVGSPEYAEAVRFALAGAPFNPDTDELFVSETGAIIHMHPLGGAL